MNKHIILLFAIIILASCEKNEPCDNLVNGVYQFPEVPKNHTMTSQQVAEFLDLPKDISGCITTEGLIETCLNYPDLSLIMASSSSPQSGYDLLMKSRFRGIRELEVRPDRGTFLLKKFQTLDPLGYDPSWEPVKIGGFGFYINYVEIILSQDINLEPLTKNEKIGLLEKAIDMYDKMKSNEDVYGLWSLGCTTTLSGRLMLQNNFGPFVKTYNENAFVRNLVTIYEPSSRETVELVNNLAKQYLTYLKND